MIIHSGLEPGHFMLDVTTPNPELQPKARTQKAWSIDTGRSKKTVRLAQFNLLQAHAVTGHKTQGRTEDRVVVCNVWRESAHWSEDYPDYVSCIRQLGWFYVAIDHPAPQPFTRRRRNTRATSTYAASAPQAQHAQPRPVTSTDAAPAPQAQHA